MASVAGKALPPGKRLLANPRVCWMSCELTISSRMLSESGIAQRGSVGLTRSTSCLAVALQQTCNFLPQHRSDLRHINAICTNRNCTNERPHQLHYPNVNCLHKANIISIRELAFNIISSLTAKIMTIRARRLRRQRNAAMVLRLAKRSSIREQEDDSVILAVYSKASRVLLPANRRYNWPLVMTAELATSKPVYKSGPFSYFKDLVTRYLNNETEAAAAEATGERNYISLVTSSVSRKLVANAQKAKVAREQNARTPSSHKKSSGTPIEDEQEQLLASSKCNKHVKINACGALFEELAKTKPSLYANAPKGGSGIDFVVSYYDNSSLLQAAASGSSHQKQRVDKSHPTLCLLHGAPGHYKDYASLINYMTSKNVRVVAPNFPDYAATFDYSFRHSSRERADFLLAFFKAINLNTIDMLIGHSSAVYTMFELTSQTLSSHSEIPAARSQSMRVKSLGLFSTPSYELPKNLAVTPLRLFTLRLFDYSFLRPLLTSLVEIFVKFQGIRNRVDKDRIDDLLIAASAVGHSEHPRMFDQLKLIQNFKLPIFMLYGTQDRLIPRHCFDRLKQDLGIRSEEQVKIYGSDGSVEHEATEAKASLIEAVELTSGGHYAFQRYSDQVNEDVHAFLARKVLTEENEHTRL